MPQTALAEVALARWERRRGLRHVRPPLSLEFEGHLYLSDDWSLGGFRLTGLHRSVAPGERLRCLMRDPTGCVSGDVVAEVVWSDGDRVGFHVLEMAPRLRRGLAAFYDA